MTDSKRPIQGATVILSWKDSSKIEVKTNAAGEYHFQQKLLCTSYTVSANAMDVRNKFSRHGYMGYPRGGINTMQSSSFIQDFVVLPAAKRIITGSNETTRKLRMDLLKYNVTKGRRDRFEIWTYTTEGDPIIEKIKFNKKVITIRTNNRRDRYRGKKIKKEKISPEYFRQTGTL